ncbi:MAG: type II secretion system GspH family protein [Erysipelotrichaceae bacterium]|nr:type II secretion system GspH family protein [Erysipelotrichaceae bacterium]MDY5252304.1 type II secretion system protein [Erysipelotrichaceae bacterium]
MLNKRGFTMLEMVICLMIISIISLLGLNFKELKIKDYHQFIYDYWLAQLASMLNRENVNVDMQGCNFSFPAYFNSKGNINMAQTIECDGKQITIQLGPGRLVY